MKGFFRDAKRVEEKALKIIYKIVPLSQLKQYFISSQKKKRRATLQLFGNFFFHKSTYAMIFFPHFGIHRCEINYFKYL